LNYLTGLCFPAGYSNGFMIPPFVKITIGDLYVNQPGFFRSINHTVENDTPWDIEEPYQAPHGIVTSIAFSIIEKHQMQTDNRSYYHFGQPRFNEGQSTLHPITKG